MEKTFPIPFSSRSTHVESFSWMPATNATTITYHNTLYAIHAYIFFMKTSRLKKKHQAIVVALSVFELL